MGENAINLMNSDRTPVAPFLPVSARDVPAERWLRAFLISNPLTNESWTVPESQPPLEQPVFGNCSFEAQPFHMFSRSGSGNDNNLLVQVYTAGQAFAAFQEFSNRANSCFHLTTRNNHQAVWNGGAIVMAGDAIAFVTGNTDLDIFIDRFRDSLISSQCAALGVNENDVLRNVFAHPTDTQGFLMHRPITEEIDVYSLPLPFLAEIYTRPTAVAEPEGPLPIGMNTVPTTEPERPVYPESPIVANQVTEIAVFEVQDLIGPGCGWTWTGQVAPVVDVDFLAEQEERVMRETRMVLNSQVDEYIQTRLYWAADSLNYMGRVNVWNRHVVRLQQIFDQFRWLSTQRQAILMDWVNWSNTFNDWWTFPQRQADAQLEFDNTSESWRQCQAQLETWPPTLPNPNYDNRQTIPNPTPQGQVPNPNYRPPSPGVGTPTIPNPDFDDTLPIGPNNPETIPNPNYVAPDPGTPNLPTTIPDPNWTPTIPNPNYDPNQTIPNPPPDCGTEPTAPEILSQEQGEMPALFVPPAGVTIPTTWLNMLPADATDIRDSINANVRFNARLMEQTQAAEEAANQALTDNSGNNSATNNNTTSQPGVSGAGQ